MSKLDIEFDRDVELATTMDIQIPALEWVPYPGGYRTVYHAAQQAVEVTMHRTDRRTVRFQWDCSSDAADEQIESILEDTFTFFLDEIDVSNPTLAELSSHYGDIVYMQTSAYRALLTTILSQNRTGEITRNSFLEFARAAPRLTPRAVAGMSEPVVKEAIRSAGPYKSDYILEASRKIAEEHHDLDAVVRKPTDDALDLLTALPGVGHKTAACVLVYSDLKRDVLPVDTHLWRVAQRTGVVDVDGKSLTRRTREAIIGQLLEQSADAGYAHLFFVLLGRNRCAAGNPRHEGCPLEASCPRNPTPNI